MTSDAIVFSIQYSVVHVNQDVIVFKGRRYVRIRKDGRSIENGSCRDCGGGGVSDIIENSREYVNSYIGNQYPL